MQVPSLLFVAIVTAYAASIHTWKIEESSQKEDVVSELSINKHSNDDQILQFSALGQKYSLPIQAADDIFAPNFQIKTESNSSIVDCGTDRLKGKFYTAKNGRGSFYIANTDGQLAVDGIVDNQIRIRPENGNHMASHIIPNPNSNAFSNDMVKHHLPYTTNKIIKDEDTEPLPDVITIEVFTVIDSILHKSLIKNGMSVEKYLGLLWNQVENEYKSFSNPKINFVIVGSTVLTNVTDWMKEAILEEKDNITEVNSHGLLIYFGHWLFTKKDDISIPNYDIAILHTGMDLASPTSVEDTFDTRNLGVAAFERVCVIDFENEIVLSSGTMEDLSGNPDITGILTITHEVGHLLGADHDNELPEERHCPVKYIMYWALDVDTLEKFSECSITDVKKHLSLKQSRCVREPSPPK